MGDQRRTDRDREQRPSHDGAARPGVEHQDPDVDQEFDGEHAQQQLQAYGATRDWSDPEHAFAGVGDQDQLWTRFEDALAGRGDAAALPTIVADMDATNRARVAKRLPDVARVAPGDTVLQLGDLALAGTTATLAAALAASPPTRKRMRAYLVDVSVEDLASDDAVIAALIATYPGPVIELAPQVAALPGAVFQSPALLAWYLDSMPDATVAAAMVRDNASATRLAGLNARGAAGWRWALAVDDALAAGFGNYLGSYAAGTDQDDVRAHLDRKVGAVPDETGDVSSLDAALAAKPLVVATVLAAFRVAGLAGINPIASHRAQLIAAASFEELVSLTEQAGLETWEQMEWLLDSKHATVERIRDYWSTSSVDFLAVLVGERTIHAIRKRFPTSHPVDLFGHRCGFLYKLARSSAPIRAWCTKGAAPLDLLRLVTEVPDDTATLWRQLSKEGVAPDWVYQLGTGDHDGQLRTLAINCPDSTIGSWIQSRLLGDARETASLDSEVKPVDAVAFAAPGERLDAHAASEAPRADEITRRALELTDAEIVELRTDPARLDSVLYGLEDPGLAAVLFRLDLPLVTLFRHRISGLGLITYIRGRDDSETVDLLSDEKAARAARAVLREPPLTALPALREPATLAAVLRANPEVLTWLLVETDAPYALGLLAHPRVVKAATAALAAAPELLKLLPPGEALPESARQALETLAGASPNGTLEANLESRVEGTWDDTSVNADEAVKERSEQLTSALSQKGLVGALSFLFDPARIKSLHIDALTAVCRERASGAHELLTDDSHAPLVGELRARSRTSPLSIFPGLSYLSLLHTPAARAWLFETEAPTVLLPELTGDHNLARLIAKQLDAGDPGAMAWLDGLPRASALNATQEDQLWQLFELVRTGSAARALFQLRFGSGLEKGYSRAELAKLWPLLDRLPEAHVAQGAIRSFHEFNDSPAAGSYSDHKVSLNDDKNDVPVVQEKGLYDLGQLLTREQVKTAFDLDEAAFESQLATGQIVAKQTDEGEERYQVEAIKTDLLTQTVLHEVGHAVDDMLGQHTELVYGRAGWRRYSEADFEHMVADLGGWGSVKAADRARIRDAWLTWLDHTKSGTTTKAVSDFVGADHPALSDDHSDVGIVKLARQRKPLELGAAVVQGGRAWLANHSWSQIYSVPERTLHAAPSVYGMSAPPEYFAECYVHYYYDYDGTAKTESKKGGRLPGWIKEYFDAQVDKLGFNPQRKT